MSILQQLNLFESTNEQNFKIFLDLDGTITDWEKSFRDLGDDLTKGLTGKEYENKFGREPLWELITKEGKLDFWSEMGWMNDGRKLWNYVKKFNPTILSTPTRSNLSKQGKEMWIKRELGEKVPFIFAKDKYKYADINSILIDNYDKKINDWINLGDGIGILHQSADKTIEELKKYGL